jgi:hypothetical protein
MSFASSEQNSRPGASASIRGVCPPLAAPKFTVGYRPSESFRDTTKARIALVGSCRLLVKKGSAWVNRPLRLRRP